MEGSIRKRGGGRNRGGGRSNRGGRGRGGSRGGRGRAQPGPPVGQSQKGHGGRKGGTDDASFMYDEYCDDDDYDGEDDDDTMMYQRSSTKGPNSQSKTPKTFSHPAQPIPNQQYSRGGGGGRSSRPRASGRGSSGRGRVKVVMQQLNMTSENQEMVKDMLQDLHGEQMDFGGEDHGYDELDVRIGNQYWTAENQLKIEEAVVNRDEQEDVEEDHSLVTVSTLAVNKLSRYGFDKSRSRDALQICDGDLGLALEYLLSEAFTLSTSCEQQDKKNTSSEIEECLEERINEKIALESIYEDRFIERIENHVWIVTLSLPYLVIKTNPPKKPKKIVENKNLCRYFKEGGHCRFGNKCKFKHTVIVPEVDVEESSVDEQNFEVEIRFPAGNMYPKEPPFIAMSTTSRVPSHICLNLTEHMINEAKSMSEHHEPCVFSVISCLEDEGLIDSMIKKRPHEFSVSPSDKPWVRKDQKSWSGDTGVESENSEIDLSQQVGSMLRMSDRDDKTEPVRKKKASSKDADLFRKLKPAEILKQNRHLLEEFKKKKTQNNYKNMQTERERLPAWGMQDEILSTIEGNQVVVISGMTGCGKTTQVPQFILDFYLNSGDPHLCNILCTQPRRISAMAVAERVSEERADKLGRAVGYQIRLEKVQSSMTRLLFCTTGIVLRRLEGDTTLDGVTHLIIDEVHERSEESDFLLMYLKDMLPRRPDLKVILMSATLNAELFCNYFSNCPVVDIPGRTYPVQQYFLEDTIQFTRFVMEENSPYARPVKHMNALRRGLLPEEMDELDIADADILEGNGPVHAAGNKIHDQNLSMKQMFLRYPDYHKQAVKSMAMMDHTKINFDLLLDLLSWIVEGSHREQDFPKEGAILVFMPGYAEIQTMFDMLKTSPVFGARNKQKFKIIPLHSTLSSEDQHAVFMKAPAGVRKIVIATNIAETSITIDDVVFVIDSGKMKEKRYDPTKGMESLDMVWVSKANAMQRKGRAGRVQAGICFHLFTSYKFNYHLRDQPEPEIQRAPLEQIVLRIKMLDIFKPLPVQSVLNMLPEPPDHEAISSAVKRLQDLGALDENGELTPLGYHVGSLPVDVRIGKLMLMGAIFRCLDSALTIAACLSFKSPFVSPFGKKHEATEKKLEFAAGNSDHLTMLNAYKAWMEARSRGSQAGFFFCQDNFLSQRTLEMLSSMKQQFVELLSDIGFVQEGISSRDVERVARGGTDGVAIVTGEEANINSKNWKLVSAVLVGSLFPNVVQVLTPENKYTVCSGGAVQVQPKAQDLRFKTKPDGYVNIHPSSVNFQVQAYESPYLVYHEKVKTTRIYIRDCTMVSVYPLLLFGGANIAVDLSRGHFLLSVDEGWIRFQADSHEVAELVKELRRQLDNLMAEKIENPHMDLCTCPRGSRIISTIVKLISTQ